MARCVKGDRWFASTLQCVALPLLAHTIPKVYRFDEGTSKLVYVISRQVDHQVAHHQLGQQNSIYVIWWIAFVPDRRLPTYVQHRSW